MTKVYLLTVIEASDYCVKGIFSSRAGAEKIGAYCKDSEVEEWDLDGAIDHEVGTTWYAEINLDDGALRRCFSEEGLRHPMATKVEFYRAAVGAPFSIVGAESPISFEHAHAVAGEKRQEWLRMKDFKEGGMTEAKRDELNRQQWLLNSRREGD
ncbi:MAG: hypothetical protein ACJ72N_07250 [Labedaea sp.]|jgi:hypothetical protein